jgi:stringent starvation protein B
MHRKAPAMSPSVLVRVLLVAASAAAGLGPAGRAVASSHREAPGITAMPKVDSTDFYMFTSYEAGRQDFTTIVACYQPFQTPYGGPNFFQMDPDAIYQIHIDNDGDGKEDITFTFRFTNALRDISIPVGNVMVPISLYNANTIGPGVLQNGALNVLESYTVDVTYGDQYTGQSSRCQNFDSSEDSFAKPADFVGNKTFNSSYESYARNHIARLRLPGARAPAKVFVGQRKDPFVVNLGEAFDLVNLNPLGPENAKPNSLADENVTAICIEIPSAFLRGGNPNHKIIGGWTSASLPKNRMLRFAPTVFGDVSEDSGPMRQVSRLGMPLVNELVIGLRDKDKFGASRPRNDAQFALYVTNPTLPAIIGQLFSVGAPCVPRNDLVSVFLTGVEGVNKPANVQASEMVRLNTDSVAFSPKPRGMQNRMGVIGGDTSGFPNGRRPGDDVVDIALRVVMGALYPDAGQPSGCAPVGNLAFTDGAFVDDSAFDAVFPYLKQPISSSPVVP